VFIAPFSIIFYTALSLCAPRGKFISNDLVPSFHLVHDGQAPSFSLEAVFRPSNQESIYHFASSLESISHPGLVMELLSNGQEPISLLPNVREPIQTQVAEVSGPVPIYYPSRNKGHLLVGRYSEVYNHFNFYVFIVRSYN
jgi:hypothetical protein